MMQGPFYVGGGITDEYARSYIEREADQVVYDLLRRGNYILVIEPRQQGKTSLINALMRRMDAGGPVFVYTNITTLDTSSEANWYQSLCIRLLKQLRFLPRENWPAIPHNSFTWRDFLSEIAIAAEQYGRLIVVALDEISAVTFPGAINFFSVLRDIYNARQSEREFRQITFILAGAFHPRDLIDDIHISPFNIARRIRLPDFTLEQVTHLVAAGGWTEDVCVQLANRIYYWTEGQPYLTHHVCAQLEAQANPEEIDRSVERLRREDENHFPAIINRLERDSKMLLYLRRVYLGEQIRFYPGENHRQAELDVLGVIKPDQNGFCKIRNRIYLAALGGIYDDSKETNADLAQPPVGPVYHIHLEKSQGVVIGDDAKVDQNFHKGPTEDASSPPDETHH